MSSKKSERAESSGGGKGMFIALIPWIAFTVLVSHSSLKLGSLAALATAIVIAVPGLRGRTSQAAGGWGGRDVHRVRRGGVPGRRFDGPLGRGALRADGALAARDPHLRLAGGLSPLTMDWCNRSAGYHRPPCRVPVCVGDSSPWQAYCLR